MTITRPVNDTNQPTMGLLRSPALRSHVLIIGTALFVGGALTRLLFPQISIGWVAIGIVTIAHLGLIMVGGAAALRVMAGRRLR